MWGKHDAQCVARSVARHDAQCVARHMAEQPPQRAAHEQATIPGTPGSYCPSLPQPRPPCPRADPCPRRLQRAEQCEHLQLSETAASVSAAGLLEAVRRPGGWGGLRARTGGECGTTMHDVL
eukprot:166564-Chlamydomonas_euryale.AAC.2